MKLITENMNKLNIMDNLPITDKDNWNEFVGGADRILKTNTPKSQFFLLWDSQIETVDCATIHYYRKNYEMEGIKIRWRGNPFNISDFGNTMNKVYE